MTVPASNQPMTMARNHLSYWSSTLFAPVGLAPNRAPAWRYLLGAVLFYVALSAILAWQWVLSGEMWMEMATNYFLHAHAPDLATRLFATDAGYIPLPQRLLALAVDALGATARDTAYWYSAIAFVGGGLLIASFCHPVYRALIPSDAARLVFCFCIAMMFDFNNRTFINFTYLGIFFSLALIALSLVPDADDAPWWAWLMPLLMISKPHHLLVLPLMLVAFVFAKRRFRTIFTVSVIPAAIQVVRIAASARDGTFREEQVADTSFVEKLGGSLVTGFGTLGEFVGGPIVHRVAYLGSEWLLVGLGVLIATGFVAIWLWRRSAPGALVAVGLAAIFLNATINHLAFPSTWNLHLGALHPFEVGRRVSTAIFGGMMALLGAAQMLVDAGFRIPLFGRSWRPSVGAIMAIWIVFSGMAFVGLKSATMKAFPTSGGSNWQAMADRVESPAAMLCVPIDPYMKDRAPTWPGTWAYERNCRQLNSGPEVSAPSMTMGTTPVTLAVPGAATASTISGIAVIVRPEQDRDVGLIAVTTDASGRQTRFAGKRRVEASGGLILLVPPVGAPYPRQVTSLRLAVDAPVGILADARGAPAVMWFGR